MKTLTLYHGSNIPNLSNLRTRSYLTSSQAVAASYAKDKDSETFYVYEFIVSNPDEILNPEEKNPYAQLFRLDSKYNHEMGHDSFQNNESLNPHW